jgi:hypothetical protein
VRTEAAEHLAGAQQRYVARTLFGQCPKWTMGEVPSVVCAEMVMAMRRVDLGHLVDSHHVRDVVEASATQLFGPGNTEQAELAHLLDVFPGKFGALIVLRGDGSDFFAGKAAHHLPNGQVFVR